MLDCIALSLFIVLLRILIERIIYMLYIIAAVLIVLWLVGLLASYTLGGVIHILLVIAIVMILLNVIRGRRAA